MVSFAREQTISLGTLAKRLDVHKDTIRDWFRRGLEHKRIGKMIFTSLEALDRFSEGNSSTSIADDAQLAEAELAARRRGVV